ncbi:hypothetical protein ACFCX4_34485 [Kitasatospora sp. NPDC056327]|uniref:hypothetical protein n=1 Tax=Kitasatospora sp. NPDC056327 TaxID=3345785 RepID=UPI0035DBD3DD
MTQPHLTHCEFVLPAGAPCAVVAIGRCDHCHAAFCRSHQGRAGTPWLCHACADRAREAAAAAAAERELRRSLAEQADRAARRERVARAHRFVAAMAAAGNPGLDTWPTDPDASRTARVSGWLLDGHSYAPKQRDSAAGLRTGGCFRNMVLTDGRVGLAMDLAYEHRRRMLEGRRGTAGPGPAAVDRELGRWFGSEARTHRRLLRLPVVVGAFVAFDRLALDPAEAHFHQDSPRHVWGVDDTFWERLEALARRHSVVF